jgi:catechol 2,3-dioxygenase-like lactoylglutathione lyase family enzyme
MSDEAISLSHLDHFVIPCSDVEEMASFYERTLDMRREIFDGGRISLHFGRQKINLQPAGRYDGLIADKHLPGTQDFCLIAETPVAEVKRILEERGVETLTGVVPRTGAQGPIASVYFRDPDGNLVEISNPG